MGYLKIQKKNSTPCLLAISHNLAFGAVVRGPLSNDPVRGQLWSILIDEKFPIPVSSMSLSCVLCFCCGLIVGSHRRQSHLHHHGGGWWLVVGGGGVHLVALCGCLCLLVSCS